MKIVFSLVNMSIKNYLPSLWLIYCPPLLSTIKLHLQCHLKIPTVTTTIYSKGGFISMGRKTWNNNSQSQIKDPNMISAFPPNKLKNFL